MQRRKRRRTGMTLLEMVLTFAIAMLVLLALFMVVSSQYNHAQAGRELLDDSAVARAILAKITSDISGSMGPVDPRFLDKSILPNNANQGTGTGGAKTTATAQQNTTDSSSANSASTNPTRAWIANFGVRGDANWMVLSASRVPGGLLLSKDAQVDVVSSDMRNISYWMTDGGLARREMSAVTSDDAPAGAPDFGNSTPYIISDQVEDIQFWYISFGGGDPPQKWDGTLLGGNDGNTPVGPPAAIKIQLTLKNAPKDDNGNPKRYTHVVALPATNGFTQSVQTPSNDNLIDVLQSGQTRPAANATTTGSGM